MTVVGSFLSSEQHPPLALVEQAVRTEQAGLEALWICDHDHPWFDFWERELRPALKDL